MDWLNSLISSKGLQIASVAISGVGSYFNYGSVIDSLNFQEGQLNLSEQSAWDSFFINKERLNRWFLSSNYALEQEKKSVVGNTLQKSAVSGVSIFGSVLISLSKDLNELDRYKQGLENKFRDISYDLKIQTQNTIYNIRSKKYIVKQNKQTSKTNQTLSLIETGLKIASFFV